LDAFLRKDALPFCNLYRGPNHEELRDLIPNFTHDLEYQRNLTKAIIKTEPEASGEWRSPEEAIMAIETIAEIPVKYASFGPASAHKKTRE
jgi:hypothetical protein